MNTNLIIAFFGAQLALVLSVWVVLTIVRSPANLEARREKLDDEIVVKDWIRLGLEELVRSLRDLYDLVGEKKKLEDRSSDSRGLGVGPAQQFFLLFFLVGSWILLYETESVIGAILNVTSGFMSLTPWMAVAGGPVVAFAVFLVSHTAPAVLHKASRARKTWRWACVGTFVSLVVLALAWGWFLSGRTVDFTDVIATAQAEGTLTKVLYALALINAIAGAFAGTGIVLLLEDRYIANEIKCRERQIRAMGEHIVRVADDLKSHGVELSQEVKSEVEKVKDMMKPAGAAAKGSPLTTVLVPVLLVLMAGTVRSEAADNRRVAPIVSSLQAPAHGTGACEALVDISISTDPSHGQKAAQSYVQTLPQYIDAKDCRLFRASAFSGGDPYTQMVEVEIPVVERRPVACGMDASKPTRAVDAFFPNMGKTRCEEEARLKEVGVMARRRQAVVEAGRKFQEVVKNTQPRGSCTALELAIELAHSRSRHVVAITDGFSTCPSIFNHAVVEDSIDSSWLTVLLIPSRVSVDRRWAELAGRIAKLQARYPGALVRPYNEMTATFWTR